MGSGSSKNSSSSPVPIVTTNSDPDKQVKGILKNGNKHKITRETVAFSRKDLTLPKIPPEGLLNVETVDDTPVEPEHESEAELNSSSTPEGFVPPAETDYDNFDDDRDRESEGSSIDQETMKLMDPGETDTDRLARLEKLHHDGNYNDTEFGHAKYKVFNDYLVWATETGSRGERVVIPDENMKVQQKKLIAETMRTLDEAKSYTGNDELHCLLVLCKMSDVRQREYVDLVTELGFARLFMKIWDRLHDQCDVKDQIAFPDAYLAINMLLDATQGFTEIGNELCRQIGDHCVPALLAVLHDVFYEVNALNKDSKKLRWMSRREFLKRVLTVLYHGIRHHMDNKTIFRECHASMLLKPYLKCRFLILRVKAIFTLAFIVTEDENASLNTTNTNIDFIIKILSKALNEPNHYSAHYNFSATQVADAMKYLAANDDNKVKFVAAGALSRILTMMKVDDLVEQRSAVDALWILSFHQDNKEAILKEKGCLEIVRDCKTKAALSRPCEAILWNVGEETYATLTKRAKDSSRKPKPDDKGASTSTTPIDTQSSVQAAAAGGQSTAANNNTAVYDNEEVEEVEEEISTNHVMLSYQWDVQKQILKVKELLQAEGYKVWMDVDHMGGSTLEAMASAVENAAVVLICFSEKYKDSPACRTEAEYTFKLNKPIIPLKMQRNYQADGWLGIMLGTKLYIETSTMDEVVDNFDRLKRELAGRGRKPSNAVATRQPSLTADDVAVKSVIGQTKMKRDDSKRFSRREAAKDAANWTNNDVNAWLTRNGMPELKNRLEGYDGGGIMGLKTIASDAPEFFYKEVKTELGLKSLREIIRFKQALDDIL